LELPERTHLVGFADDIAVVVVAKTIQEAEELCNAVIVKVICWLKQAGLNLAQHKTEAVLISSRKRVETATINIGGHVVTSTRAIRYLGVTLDTRLSFREHLVEANRKAANVARALSRIMLNCRGPKQGRRLLLQTVCSATMRYAAPVWAEAAKKRSYTKGLTSTYRLCALRVCSGFRTISEDAALVIAGMVPIDLLAAERQETELANMAQDSLSSTSAKKREVRAISLTNWQRRWEESPKGHWTFRLIPDVGEWTGRRHSQVEFYLTKALSGHRCFRSFLKRFVDESEDCCPSSGSGVTEDPLHVLFVCRRFVEDRLTLENILDEAFIPSSMVPQMLHKPENWEAIAEFVAKSMMELRALEGARNGQE
ncbi:hypothetical protein KR026_011507, partial [Drosophila bipectinata]